MNLKPGKKVVGIAFFLLLFLVGVFSYATPKNSQRETRNLIVTAGEVGESDDWKKTLSTIGAHSASSSQTESATSSSFVSSIPQSPENLSNTDVLGRKLFVAFAELSKKEGLTPENIKKIATELAQTGIASSTIDTHPYKLSDIRTIPSSTDAKAKYAQKVNSAISRHYFPDLGREIQIVDLALKSKNETDLASLSRSTIAYENLKKEFLSFPAPTDYAQLHLNFLNSFATLTQSSAVMVNTFKDPVSLLGALTTHVAAHTTLLGGLDTLF